MDNGSAVLFIALALSSSSSSSSMSAQDRPGVIGDNVFDCVVPICEGIARFGVWDWWLAAAWRLDFSGGDVGVGADGRPPDGFAVD